MSDEYTPSTEDVRIAYICGGSYRHPGRGEYFDRWLAAHDAEIREQIARDIEAKADDPDPTLEPQFFMAIDIAASIARGKDQTDE